MNIYVNRFARGTESTLSHLSTVGLSGNNYVLEDDDKGLMNTMSLAQIKAIKVHGRTAIPTGTYKVIMSHSSRFGIVMPEVLNVPGYEGIRIHKGNYVGNTDGCLLPGTNPDKDKNGFYRVWGSGDVLDPLTKLIAQAFAKKEPIWCIITRSY